MRMVHTRDGAALPCLGQGTWEMGVHRHARELDAAFPRPDHDVPLETV